MDASGFTLSDHERPPSLLPRFARGRAMTLSQTMSEEVASTDFSRLIRLVAETRDREAFAALFAHFAPRVKSYLMRSGVPSVRAEELAQDTLLTLWRKAGSFDPAKARASTWIFVIARNLKVDAFRRERPADGYLADPSDLPDGPPQADQIMTSLEQEEKVREAFASLPEEQSKVIRLSFFHDKPHAQIASELGIPLGTVKSRIRLALKRLHDIVGER